MTKYCSSCKMPKSKHNIYTVQGFTYVNCKESNCEDQLMDFVSKKELLLMDMNHSHSVHNTHSEVKDVS